MATSPTELARDAILRGEILRSEFDFLRSELDKLNLTRLGERVTVVEATVVRLERRADDADRLRERLAVVESQLADTKKARDEADKRQWQFVYIFAGAMASLLVTVVVQLVLAWVKK